MEFIAEAFFPTRFGKFRIYSFREGSKEHLALAMGLDDKVPLVRIHSKCLTGDTFCSLRCDCRQQLEAALNEIAKKGCGMLIYLDQEGRGIGLSNKIKAYALQDEGMDTVEANKKLGFKPDERHYQAVAEILKHFKIKKIALLTNNPQKIKELEDAGITVAERIPLITEPTEYNGDYLKTKKNKLGHQL